MCYAAVSKYKGLPGKRVGGLKMTLCNAERRLMLLFFTGSKMGASKFLVRRISSMRILQYGVDMYTIGQYAHDLGKHPCQKIDMTRIVSDLCTLSDQHSVNRR